MEELNSTPAKNITEETTAESFYNTFGIITSTQKDI